MTGSPTTATCPKPANKYYYPGFTIGGPVLLPFTRFNRKKDKLFFFTGFQYFYQVLDTGLLRATVPTAGRTHRQFLSRGIGDGRQHHRLRIGSAAHERSRTG